MMPECSNPRFGAVILLFRLGVASGLRVAFALGARLRSAGAAVDEDAAFAEAAFTSLGIHGVTGTI